MGLGRSVVEEGAVTSPVEGGAVTSPVEEGAVTSPVEEGAATSLVEEGAPRPSRDRPTSLVEEGAPRPSRDRPAGVVFDLGRVLVQWDPYAAVAAGVGAERARAFVEADDFDFMAWNHRQDSGGDWDSALSLVERTHPHWIDAARAYRTHFGASLTGEVPGTSAIVAELHGAGVPLFGLTNWSHELYPQAPARFEVLRLLDDVIVSGTEGVAKPDPAIFAILSARAGLPLDRLLFIDDSPANVAGALAVGLDSILFTDAASLRAALAGRGLPVAVPPSPT